MRKTHYTKLLAGFLCAAVLSADLMSAGFFSLVAEATELSGTETQMAETADAQEEIFEDFSSVSETGAVIESTQMQSSEMAEMDTETEEVRSMQEETVSENAGNAETATENLTQIEGTSENAETPETEMTETTDISESETQETETQVVLDADGNIASGVIDEDYGHITWVIDADGKLTVTGTGDLHTPYSSSFDLVPWYEYREVIKSAKINVTGMTDASYMFFECTNMVSIDLSNFNTSKITNMGGIFQYCSSLSSLNLNNFDTSNVIDMWYMFFDCKSLTNLNLSSFDTSNVTDMSGMFCGCSSLSNLNLSNFNTSNVTNMWWMFKECSSLINLDLRSFDTSNITDMSGMFSGCNLLTNLDLSNFNTSNVTDVYNMFESCTNLVTLYTPYNVRLSIPLPTATPTDKWYRSDGTVVTELPKSLSYSIVLGKNFVPQGKEPEQTFTVIFDTQGGKSLAPITGLTAGSTITLPTDITKDGYLFDGWYTQPKGGDKIKGSTYTVCSRALLHGHKAQN